MKQYTSSLFILHENKSAFKFHRLMQFHSVLMIKTKVILANPRSTLLHFPVVNFSSVTIEVPILKPIPSGKRKSEREPHNT